MKNNCLCLFLLDSDFGSCVNSDDIECAWASFKKVIFDAMPLFVPSVKIHPLQRPKWFSSDLKHQSNCLRSLKRRLRGNHSKVAIDRLQVAVESFQSNLSVAKSEFEWLVLHVTWIYITSLLHHYVFWVLHEVLDRCMMVRMMVRMVM